MLQELSNMSGIISLGIVLLGAFFAVKANLGKASGEAQASAITAMQAELVSLRNRVSDTEKENTRLELVIGTICTALKMKGLTITIQGEMINIQDSNGSSSAKIHNP